MAPKRTDTIFVKSLLKPTKDGGELLAIFDKDDRHPSGECFIAGPGVHEVFPSPQVSAAITAGKLAQVRLRDAKDDSEGVK